MAREYRTLADTMRRVAGAVALRVSPPPERFHVTRLSPLTLEAFGSDKELVDGEDGFDVARGVRSRAQLGDTLLVSIDRHGDHFAHAPARSAEVEEEEPSQHSGHGSPEGHVKAVPGSFYQRTDGGAGHCLYVKEEGDGKTGWVAK